MGGDKRREKQTGFSRTLRAGRTEAPIHIPPLPRVLPPLEMSRPNLTEETPVFINPRVALRNGSANRHREGAGLTMSPADSGICGDWARSWVRSSCAHLDS